MQPLFSTAVPGAVRCFVFPPGVCRFADRSDFAVVCSVLFAFSVLVSIVFDI